MSAFDQEQDRTRQAARTRQIEQMHDRHAEIAATVLQKVAERLRGMDARAIRPADIARLLDIAARVQRAALGVAPPEFAEQPRTMFDADQIRAALKAEGLLRDVGGVLDTTDILTPPAERARRTD